MMKYMLTTIIVTHYKKGKRGSIEIDAYRFN